MGFSSSILCPLMEISQTLLICEIPNTGWLWKHGGCRNYSCIRYTAVISSTEQILSSILYKLAARTPRSQTTKRQSYQGLPDFEGQMRVRIKPEGAKLYSEVIRPKKQNGNHWKFETILACCRLYRVGGQRMWETNVLQGKRLITNFMPD